MSTIMERAKALRKRDREIISAWRKAVSKAIEEGRDTRCIAQVARRFGLTRARVSQIIKAANGGA